jgi:hypothetical protein
MVDTSIHNANNRQDGPIGLSFRRRDVLCSICMRVTQSYANYEALDTLMSHMLSIRLSVGFFATNIDTFPS